MVCNVRQLLGDVRRRARSVILIGFWSLVVVFAPSQVLADPLQQILEVSALQGVETILDDETLLGIRGRGAEGPDLSASGNSEVAVILWDEQQRHLRSQQSTGFSQTTGHGNAQTTTLVMQRY